MIILNKKILAVQLLSLEMYFLMKQIQSLRHKLSSKFKKKGKKAMRGKSFLFDEEKHPMPFLPPCPDGLTENQVGSASIALSR